jgi:hypothetical protein
MASSPPRSADRMSQVQPTVGRAEQAPASATYTPSEPLNRGRHQRWPSSRDLDGADRRRGKRIKGPVRDPTEQPDSGDRTGSNP